MPLLDDRGRLFGRVNLIDAAVGLFVVALVPAAYVSWALFRTPPPVIESVVPVAIAADQPDQLIDVRGRHLRPFLNARVGTTPAGYLFESPERAQVRVPALPPGTYDLVLLDSLEIARLRNAVTVKPGMVVEMHVRFVTRPEILDEVARAHRESPRAGATAPTRPILVSYEVTDELLGTTKPDLAGGRVSIVKAVVRLTANWTASGWRANRVALKAGAPFTLTAPTYVLEGDILSIAAVDAGK